jgi:hypothetical protein
MYFKMSVPAPMKVTSLTVKNTLSANEAFVQKLHIKDEKKFVNVMEFITNKLTTVNELEKKLKDSLLEIEKVINEIKNIKVNEAPVAVKGPKGDQGIPGVPGAPGKIGPRGLRGQTVNKISQLADVDTSNIKDGCALIWSEKDSKWVTQNIFDE